MMAVELFVMALSCPKNSESLTLISNVNELGK